MRRASVRRWCRGICAGAAVLALLALGWQIGSGVRQVRAGERTPAEVMVEVGEWLGGKGC